MIHNHDRSRWFGASDTSTIMGAWDTESFRKWWLVKLGIRQERFTTPAMQTGNAYEGRILDYLGVKHRDGQRRRRRFRLRVNYDGMEKSLITEVKTTSKPYRRVTRAHWQQCQVEMFSSGIFRRKQCRIAVYRVTEAEILNYFLPIDPERLTLIPVEYDEGWIKESYLPRLRYLAKCLRSGRWPKEEEV